jgi:hypothetical protein
MGMIPIQGVYGRRNCQLYFHRIVNTTAGAISTQDSPADSGVIASKVAATNGRYLLTLAQPVSPGNAIKRQILFISTSIVGPDTAAFAVPGASAATDGFIRQEKISNNTPNGTAMWQFTRGDTNADAELPDNTVWYVVIVAAA